MVISVGYRVKSKRGVQFFKKVQNKIHYAVHGETAAEVIYHRADAEKDFMGLTTFVGSQPTLKEAIILRSGCLFLFLNILFTLKYVYVILIKIVVYGLIKELKID